MHKIISEKLKKLKPERHVKFNVGSNALEIGAIALENTCDSSSINRNTPNSHQELATLRTCRDNVQIPLPEFPSIPKNIERRQHLEYQTSFHCLNTSNMSLVSSDGANEAITTEALHNRYVPLMYVYFTVVEISSIPNRHQWRSENIKELFKAFNDFF